MAKIGLLVMLLGAVAAMSVSLAAAQSNETETRITARRLTDGRVEFALNEQQADGGWGERILPSRRYFPANATVDAWLVSSPVLVSRIEVRIAARRLTDGRTEFALQRRDGTGWSGHILPRLRFFPADSRGRWLNSSPFVVERTYPFEGSGDIFFTARDEFTDDLRTTVYSRSGDNLLVVACGEGQLLTGVTGEDVPTSDIRGQHTVLWRVDSNSAVEEAWDGSPMATSTFDLDLYKQLRYGQSVIFRISGWRSSETVRFDLAGMFDTPAQWNIDNCGRY